MRNAAALGANAMLELLWVPLLWFLLLAALALSDALLRKGWKAESCRKLIHVGLGLPVLFFPLLFRRPEPVLLLLGGCALLFAALRRGQLPLGNSLHAVERSSLGEYAYLIAVGLLWLFSSGRASLFLPPVLVLMVSDAAAALVGKRWGRLSYRTTEGRKSWEGSLAFWASAFLLIVAALRFWDQGTVLEHVLLAAIAAGILMLMEGVSWQGLDNLFIPLAVQALLLVYQDMAAEALLQRGLVLVLLGLLLQLLQKQTLLNPGGAQGAVLAGYMAFAFGGLRWLWAPLVFFMIYAFTTRKAANLRNQQQGIFAVLAVAGVPVAWAALYWLYGLEAGFAAAQAAYVAQCACTLEARCPEGRCPRIWRGQLVLLSSGIVGILPAIGRLSFGLLLAFIPVAWCSAELFFRWQLRKPSPGSEDQRWQRHAWIGFGASSLAWALARMG